MNIKFNIIKIQKILLLKLPIPYMSYVRIYKYLNVKKL